MRIVRRLRLSPAEAVPAEAVPAETAVAEAVEGTGRVPPVLRWVWVRGRVRGLRATIGMRGAAA